MTTIKPRFSVERAVMALLLREITSLQDNPRRVGGDPPNDIDVFYIEISKVPAGSHDQIQGDTVIDIDCYAPSYATAESCALAVEAVVLGYPHVVQVDGRKRVLDRVTQNVEPTDRPWEDDSVFRLGATYVITTRRP